MITEEEIQSALNIIQKAVEELPSLSGQAEDEVVPPPEKKVKIGVDN